jgi:hypothetical protein
MIAICRASGPEGSQAFMRQMPRPAASKSTPVGDTGEWSTSICRNQARTDARAKQLQEGPCPR